MSNKKWNWALPLVFSVVLIAGMWLGHCLTLKSGQDLFQKNKGSALQETLDLMRLHYVDTLKIDSIEQLSIEQLMDHLDPHSIYLAPQALAAANEELSGNFEGIGVEFTIRKDSVIVTHVISKGPSSVAGLEPGDRIIKAGDSALTYAGIEAERVKNLIRGPKRSTITIQVFRDGKKIEKKITRGAIPLPAVDAAYLIDDTTGYIKLNRFSENSYEEFMEALEDLLQQGMLSLVFDLRGNGGGFMNEATDMADEFLDGDKLIVYTKGAHYPKREYRCKRPGLFEKGKLMVLVNEDAASASEVLAGALQDWCRATLVGMPTFGKGLVQEQFELSNQSAIRLTVARYYSPLGRSIQRSYENGNEAYHEAAVNRSLQPLLNENDSMAAILKKKRFLTACGDTLYGGMGIMPHLLVAVDYQTDTKNWIAKNDIAQLEDFTVDFYRRHHKQVQAIRAVNSMEADPQLRNQLTKEWKSLNPAASPLPVDMYNYALARIARFRFGNNGYHQLVNQKDPVIETALKKLRD
ncbi:MAG: PDZ domain-containing protein [Sphingomonadales bacterium]|nr:PDZ domain-containing protein [Sphingomonadales bacterium]